MPNDNLNGTPGRQFLPVEANDREPRALTVVILGIATTCLLLGTVVGLVIGWAVWG